MFTPRGRTPRPGVYPTRLSGCHVFAVRWFTREHGTGVCSYCAFPDACWPRAALQEDLVYLNSNAAQTNAHPLKHICTLVTYMVCQLEELRMKGAFPGPDAARCYSNSHENSSGNSAESGAQLRITGYPPFSQEVAVLSSSAGRLSINLRADDGHDRSSLKFLTRTSPRSDTAPSQSVKTSISKLQGKVRANFRRNSSLHHGQTMHRHCRSVRQAPW